MDASADDLRKKYLAALAAGDTTPKQLLQLFVEHPWYQQQLHLAAQRALYVHRLPRDWHEDVEQEAVTLLAEKLERLPDLHINPAVPESKFGAWLSRIIYRDCLEAVRRLKRQYRPHAQVHSWDRVSHDSIQRLEGGMDIDAAIGKLPREQRLIMGLFFQGYTVAEIARHRGRNYDETYDRYLRALRALLRLLR